MTADPIASRKYEQLRKAIARELESGARRIRRSYQEEIVRTTWNTGKILRGTLGLEDQPSAENAALIANLCRDFGRSDNFFYMAAKLHRLYPGKAPVALSLSHYSLLLGVEDPRERLALEKKALAEGINAKDFRMYTRLPYALTHPNPGFDLEAWGQSGGERPVLAVERGRLYHYRVSSEPAEGRVLLDIGFGVERDVRSGKERSLRAG